MKHLNEYILESSEDIKKPIDKNAGKSFFKGMFKWVWYRPWWQQVIGLIIFMHFVVPNVVEYLYNNYKWMYPTIVGLAALKTFDCKLIISIIYTTFIQQKTDLVSLAKKLGYKQVDTLKDKEANEKTIDDVVNIMNINIPDETDNNSLAIDDDIDSYINESVIDSIKDYSKKTIQRIKYIIKYIKKLYHDEKTINRCALYVNVYDKLIEQDDYKNATKQCDINKMFEIIRDYLKENKNELQLKQYI
jgi:hypothetical protein